MISSGILNWCKDLNTSKPRPFKLYITARQCFIVMVWKAVSSPVFPKIYGLSSLRIGWGYGSQRIIDALNNIKPPFNVNEVAQKAAVESLKDNKFISRNIKHNIFYATKLKDFLNKFKGKRSNSITCVEFDSEDIQREEVVKEILDIYSGDVPKIYHMEDSDNV